MTLPARDAGQTKTKPTAEMVEVGAKAVWKLRNPRTPWASVPRYWKRKYRASTRAALKAAFKVKS